MHNEYSIVWQQVYPGSNIAKRFGVNNECYLPFYVSGFDFFKLQNKESIELNELMLLKGILFAYNDSPIIGAPDQELFDDLLDDLYQGFHVSSLEKTIFDMAAILRQEYSYYPAYKVLHNGSLIIPYSSKIKCDLILSVWALLNDEPARSDIEQLLEQVNSAFLGINLHHILQESIEMVVYTNFVALYFLKKSDELNKFLEEFIYIHVHNRMLKNKIKYLLETDLSIDNLSSAFLTDKPAYPKSIKESIDQLMQLIPKEQLEEMKRMTSEEIYKNHMTLGMFIRNKFGLWDGNESLLKDCKTSDADDASEIILKEFINYLHSIPKIN